MRYPQGARTCYPEKARAELGQIEENLDAMADAASNIEAESEAQGGSDTTAAASVKKADVEVIVAKEADLKVVKL